jgi:hypothetical protein
MRITAGPTAHRSPYHFPVATDYGGGRGEWPWNDPQPPYPGQQPPGQPRSGQSYPGQSYPGQSYPGKPHPGQPYPGEPRPGQPYQGQPGYRLPQWVPSPGPGVGPGAGPGADPAVMARRRRARLVAIILLVLGAVGFLASVAGLASQVMPRRFTASQQQQITDWELGKRWRALPASVIFPASVSYPPPGSLADDPSLALSAQRVGIASQASCVAATDPTAAAVLDRDGCTAMLRATYVDETSSYVVTVGAAVLPGTARASAAAKAIAADGSPGGLGPTVHTVRFAGTLAGSFSNGRRQVSGVLAAGAYVVLYTVGYADSRPKEPVAGDNYAYGEMTNSGTGVAHAVLSVLAAPVASPRCPGTPGC